MAQSLSKVMIHPVLSTKNRSPIIHNDVRQELSAYVVGILRHHESPSIITEAVGDYIHIVFVLSKNLALARAVEEIKKGSSKWIKNKGAGLTRFYRQNGYGAFSVSPSNTEEVSRYTASQEEHHRKMTFQEELRILFGKHGVEFDERYVWD